VAANDVENDARAATAVIENVAAAAAMTAAWAVANSMCIAYGMAYGISKLNNDV